MSWFSRVGGGVGDGGAPAAPAPSAAGARATAGAAKAGRPQGGQPLLLIGFDEGARKWFVNPEAAALLERVPGPLCTLAVCGRARQGKSFLLTTLLGRLTGQELPSGFKISPTQRSCTRGLWVWSEPIPSTDASGRPCNLLLVDCEGIDAVDQGAQHSAQIFSLAVLLSSVFVYNSLGAIDAVALERLAMVCELAKRIKDKSGRGGGLDYWPAFVWLLRDFQLIIESSGAGGGPSSPASYLEDVLAERRGAGVEESGNQMRATIKSVFPERDAFTLLRPMLLEDELANLDKFPFSKLRPEFRKGVDELTRLLRLKAHPLAVAGQLLSGRAYCQLAGAYCDAINGGAVPQLVTAWQGVARAECQHALDAALSAYEGSFTADAARSEEELLTTHQAALSAALAAFKAGALGDAALTGEFEERLRKTVDVRFTAARAKLRAAAEAAAGGLLSSGASKLAVLVEAPGARVEDVANELRRFYAEFDAAVPGAAKWQRAAEFAAATALPAAARLHAAAIAERDEARKRAADADKRSAQMRADAGRAADADARAAQLEAELASARDAAAAAGARASSQAALLAQAQQDLAAARSGAQDAAALHRDLEAARAEAGRAAAAAAAAEARVKQLEAAAAEAAREAAQLRTALAEAQGAVEQARAAADRVAAEKSDERATANRSLKELAELQAQLAGEREAHDATRGLLRDAEATATDLRRRLEQQAAATPQRAPAAGFAAGAPPSPLSPMSPGAASPEVAAGDAAAAAAALPEDVGSLTLAELKEWVTSYRLEDGDYMALASRPRAKKAEWVEYVKRRAGRSD
ncbi:hypothetical protein Rsub_12400 [Raphidocelis subcapitata]|uniref:GB1/RHD3-type G domain-containing protein n=1 Tax=Raphidocelis subcapitata TaxID=307507 RepID=A0A2V0PL45_9CHLO|nr:hypothetical protein Rsub_12400 [Raphidocelis subcapitata]|eukprot:GBF99772.1 hypothetical protein Rsub_12400 [Raphidocelis subcapitata]